MRLAIRRQIKKEDRVISENSHETTALLKRKRGPTKMKTITVDGQSRMKLVFNEYGQPIRDKSIGLTFFLFFFTT